MTELQNSLTEISNIFLKDNINEQDKIEAQNKLKDIHEIIKNRSIYEVEYIKIGIKFNDRSDGFGLKQRKKKKICSVESDVSYDSISEDMKRGNNVDYYLFKNNKIHKSRLKYFMETSLNKISTIENNIDEEDCTKRILITSIKIIE
jgi:hypothetical protein